MDVAEEYGNPINVDQTYPTIGFLLLSFSQSGLLLNKNHNLALNHETFTMNNIHKQMS